MTKYTYDGAGRLATIVDPHGNTVTQNTYDAPTGRISKQIDAKGKETLFGWTPAEGAPAGSGEPDMTGPDGGGRAAGPAGDTSNFPGASRLPAGSRAAVGGQGR